MRPRIAIQLSILWVALGALLFSKHPAGNFQQMSLNEIGDYIGGFVAPLALFWLVAGYFQQSKELRQNTEALKQQGQSLELQVLELKNSVEQQEKMAKAASQQSNLSEKAFNREQKQLRRSAQPHFIWIGPSSIGDRLGKKAVEYKLRNIGNVITDLEIFNNADLEIFPKRIPILESRQDLNLKVLFPAPGNYSAKVTFEFRDALGDRVELAFRLVAIDDQYEMCPLNE